MATCRFWVYEARNIGEGLMLNSGELIKCLHGLLKFECRLQVLWNRNGNQGLDRGGLFAFVSSFIESILHVYRAKDICCLQGNDSQFLLRCQNCRRQNWPSSRGELTFPVVQQPSTPRLAVSLWLMCVALENLPKKIIFKKEAMLCISSDTNVGLTCHICFRYPGYSSEPYAKAV